MWEGRNYVNGRFVKPDCDYYSNINPATEKSLGDFPQSDYEAREALNAAREAFPGWRRKSRIERAEYFYKIAQIIERRRKEIATVISLETGKNFNESIAEVNEALHMSQYAFGTGRNPHGEAVASELAEKDSYMLRKPKGVIAIVAPFNFPIAIGAFWCAAPALVEGNTVVLKPSEDAPMSSQVAAEIYHEAGVPAGVFNVVHGDGRTGDALIRDPRVDHVCFTGSALVGQHVRKVCAESWHKTCSCEMGSKSAVIVFDDANLDLAIPACVASALKLSGQRCVSAGRMIVQSGIVDEFMSKFVLAISKLKTGNPFKVVQEQNHPIFYQEPDDDYYYGPLINKDALNKVTSYNREVFQDDSNVVMLKGERIDCPGFFMTPTVYMTKWKNASYLKNEVFGPHVAIIPFDTKEEAVHIYNDTEYGLAVGVITENFKTARYMRDECDYGMCYWNGGSIAAESHLAFGGVKKSGNGYPSAARTFRAVTHEVSWTVNHGDELSFPQGMK
tara:strand:- start:2933 stop:4441 length:1509 start_codon:yes stop_codon:yes gene_type:complete